MDIGTHPSDTILDIVIWHSHNTLNHECSASDNTTVLSVYSDYSWSMVIKCHIRRYTGISLWQLYLKHKLTIIYYFITLFDLIDSHKINQTIIFYRLIRPIIKIQRATVMVLKWWTVFSTLQVTTPIESRFGRLQLFTNACYNMILTVWTRKEQTLWRQTGPHPVCFWNAYFSQLGVYN